MMTSIFNSTKSKPIAEMALSARRLKQDVIASNLANIDTPFYKARDVSFESALKEKALELYGLTRNDKELKLAQTHENHLDKVNDSHDGFGTIFLRDGHMARNDANTVDLDIETSELSKNNTMMNALTKALKKQGGIFKAMLDSSAKI